MAITPLAPNQSGVSRRDFSRFRVVFAAKGGAFGRNLKFSGILREPIFLLNLVPMLCFSSSGSARFMNFGVVITPKCCFWVGPEAPSCVSVGWIPIASRKIPWQTEFTDEDGHERAQRPIRQVRFHTGTRFHRTKRSGAQASRHPPRWHAQPDRPRDGNEGGGSGSGSSPIRRCRSRVSGPQGSGKFRGEGTVTGARASGTQVQRLGDIQGGRERPRLHSGRLPSCHRSL